ncbi:leucine-rich repeat extensin-like protein 4 [Argentina anserina]|uniref:leucine-rich repeat extensin-like protein 4 n=1 Tax=Argentina anserina TaxID=57926 RepID=UPI00217626E1|nr:leucine-rich repeat extensin-like protein 4 [Potentilla anserina]
MGQFPQGPPIKVNLQSKCLDCQVKLKKKLQKMSGVHDVHIVPEQGGTVTVSGSIDSKLLMEVIRNNYKEAKLLCPFEKNEPSKNAVCQQMSCSDDESDDSKDDYPGHNFPANNKPDNDDAGSISEPKKDKKTKMCGIMRCFGKKSNPTPIRPPPPRPKPEPRLPLMGIPANGVFQGPLIRPAFRPGMPWMPPYGPPPPPYVWRPELPTAFGYPFQRSPPRSNPMVHYTDYRDNYRYH